MDEDRVAYEPVSVKDVLAEMKDTAELLIDLSYSAVLLGSDDIAEEVLDLESQMEVLHLQARMGLLMAARNPEDAESLAPVLGVVGAAEKVSDAAGDIAKVVLEDIGLPEAMRAALPEAVESVERAPVIAESAYVGRTLGDITLETETGVRVIAIRRDGEWLLNPGPETTFLAEDVALLRGPRKGLTEVYETLTGEAYVQPEPPEQATSDLERAVDSIVLMKNMSELAVDLAYGSVLFDSKPVAEEVLELEAEVDALQSRFEAWVLRAAGRADDPVDLRGLVQLARATEVISDAALEISEGVLRGIGTHPVVAAAVEESDEVIVRFTVDPESELVGRTLGDAAVKTETGMRVIAVRHTGRESRRTGREGGDWVISPGATTEIEPGDVLLAKGTRTGAGRLSDLVS
ncbi:potassium channel family protein [Halapricum hydrolyticum]|uniref:Potassium channel protein n=1 Tax=Halapricum hydrolyticum TaxID=2979991 RepID=A0AAE3LEX8_9EURY|nr:TrkA C-terminal domain-containing protein [Halapricum hydrolyticum]MCU4717797.1 potassium channel protein [Halapricum hydrolyticum]MCU4726961.1 potassium channel protein [Halapricum hydrolyticum]